MPRRSLVALILSIAFLNALPAQPPAKPERDDSARFEHEQLAKRIDEAALFHRVEDLAEVDKVRYTGPPPRYNPNPTAQGAGNPVIITAYTFLPRKRPAGAKLPLLVFAHG